MSVSSVNSSRVDLLSGLLSCASCKTCKIWYKVSICEDFFFLKSSMRSSILEMMLALNTSASERGLTPDSISKGPLLFGFPFDLSLCSVVPEVGAVLDDGDSESSVWEEGAPLSSEIACLKYNV